MRPDIKSLPILYASFTLVTITLAISPFPGFDPFNPIKLVTLTILSFVSLSILYYSKIRNFGNRNYIFHSTVAFFILWALISSLTSSGEINQSFWGVFGRNNGILAYISMILIMYFFIAIYQQVLIYWIIGALSITGFVTAVLILIRGFTVQNMWLNFQGNYGTLGNINFASSFLAFSIVSSFHLLYFTWNFSSIWKKILFIDLLFKIPALVLTQSLQGIILTFIGIVMYFALLNFGFLKNIVKSRFTAFLLPIVVFSLVILSILNFNTFRPFFGQSLIYRFDYWLAGLRMIEKNPIFGVGFDSYIDNYRIYRSSSAAEGISRERFSDSAHNIFIDIGVNGGIPLLTCFMIINGFIFFYSCKSIFLTQGKDFSFNILFAVWCMYQIQSLISINQISLSVWNWAISGILISYGQQRDNVYKVSKSSRRTLKRSALKSIILGVSLGALGFLISIKPIRDDARIYNALMGRNGNVIFESVLNRNATSFHLKKALNLAIEFNDQFLATSIISELKSRYPKDVGAWQVIASSNWYSESEKQSAIYQLKLLDPQANYLKSNT